MRLLSRICLLALPLFLASSIASAQTTTIPVRAGEHAEFTRLVVQIPDGNTWRVTKDESTARLTVDGPALQFDLSQTFSKIPRTRLRDAIATPGTLDLYFGCHCEIRAYEDIPGFLLIDITGAAHAPRRPRPASTVRPPQRPKTVQWPGGAQPADSSRAGQDLARSMRGQSPHDRTPMSLTLQKFDSSASALSLPLAPDQTDRPAAPAITRAELTQELGRMVAASVAQGRLAPEKGLTVDLETQEIHNQSAPHLDQAIAGHLVLPSHAAAPDQKEEICSRLARLALTDVTAATSNNPSPPTLDALFGEFDKLDPDKGLDLIRSYLALGFGAEARLTASLVDLPLPMTALVNAISYIIDLDAFHDTDGLAGLSACGPDGALWEFLGHPPETKIQDFPVNALLQAVDALPPHLRLHLGPEILKRLTAQGQNTAAKMVEAALDRVSAQNSDSLQLAKVALALSATPQEHADALENTLSPETSDQALIFLLARREANDEPVATDLIELGKSRRLALRGDPQAVEITKLVSRALARNGAYAEAFSLAQSWDSGLAPNVLTTLRNDLLSMLTQHADDSEFVARIFDQRPWVHGDMSPQLVAQIAQRLSELGFDPQARLMQQSERASAAPHPEQSTTRAERQPGTETSSPEADNAASPTLTDQEINDLVRARAAQRAARSEQPDDTPERQTGPVTSPVDQAIETAVTEQTFTAAPAALEAAEVASPPPTTPRPERAQPGPPTKDGLLAETRDSLQQSAVLRERLEAMLANDN